MQQVLGKFWRSDEAQDIIEYTLLVSFIVIAASAMMISNGVGVQRILTFTTDNLDTAQHAAASAR